MKYAVLETNHGSTMKDGSSIKVQKVDQGTSSLLKMELISGSHGVYN